jgi:hypothetical protein
VSAPDDYWVVRLNEFNIYVDEETATRLRGEMVDDIVQVFQFQDLGRMEHAIRSHEVKAIWHTTPEARALDRDMEKAHKAEGGFDQ